MPKLLLMRHAEAVVFAPGGDGDRPLTEAGRREALRFGEFCSETGLLPDQALISSALRTRETYAALEQAFPQKPIVSFEATLYKAATSVLLESVRQTSNWIKTLLIVGHNPGIAELALSLVADTAANGTALAAMRQQFPSPALAIVYFDMPWSEISAGCGQLESFLTAWTLHERSKAC